MARRASRNPLEQGGWSGFFTFWSGVDHWNPANHASIRGNGENAWPGWPTIPAMEAQREEARKAWKGTGEAKTEAMVKEFRSFGATVTLLMHPGGHTIAMEHVRQIGQAIRAS